MATNWAGNLEYLSTETLTPSTIEEVVDLVQKLPRIKTLGTRHSFNNGADTDGIQISTAALNQIINLNPNAMTVTVGAGTSYGKLSSYLAERGYAIHNLASLPHISIGGAVATATHGSGVRNGNLSTAVTALEFVNGKGELVRLDENMDDFFAAVVHLGAIGVTTSLTLKIQPSFEVRQLVYQNLPFSVLADDFEAVMGSAYSVSLFTTWSGDTIDQVWQKHVGLTGEPTADLLGAKLSPVKLHPLPGHPAEFCTEQLGIPGPWNERLAHFKMEFTPSSGEELQSEYMVPRQYSYQALQAINSIRDQISPILHVSEVRTAAEDRFWMSPSYGQPVTCIHLTWKKNWEAVRAILPTIEAVLEPYGAMPHWGKLFLMGSDRLKTVFPRFEDFRAYANSCDPKGKFRNAYLDQVLG